MSWGLSCLNTRAMKKERYREGYPRICKKGSHLHSEEGTVSCTHTSPKPQTHSSEPWWAISRKVVPPSAFHPRSQVAGVLCQRRLWVDQLSREKDRRRRLRSHLWDKKNKIRERGKRERRKSKTNPKNSPLILELPDLVFLSSRTWKLSGYFMGSETTRRKEGGGPEIKLMSR